MAGKAKDSDLAVRAMAGDQDAFAGLVDLHHAAIYRMALRITGSRQDAEDLTQETFLRVHARFGSYDPARPFEKWLYAVGLNAVRDHLKFRRRTRLPDPAPLEPEADPEEPDQALARSQDRDQMAQLLLQLPLVLREAVVMRYYLDLSFAEIAQAVDISLSSAKMRVYRGLDHLRRLMGASQSQANGAGG